MKKIGMIGVGNMGGAILRGMIASGYVAAEDVMACLHSEEKRQALAAEIPGLTCTTDAKKLAHECHMIVLAVKPQVLGTMLDEIKGEINDRALVSIAAGWTMDMLTNKVAGTTATLLRVMPNTPAMIGEGMIVFESGDSLTQSERAFAETLFGSVGEVISVEPKLMDAVTAVSGSGPAYVYLFIEALADGGVKAGLPRPIALKLAAQTVKGSAMMVSETGVHPGELKDRVCSPGGTTIDAVAVLEQKGFRGAVIAAVDACREKSERMSK